MALTDDEVLSYKPPKAAAPRYLSDAEVLDFKPLKQAAHRYLTDDEVLKYKPAKDAPREMPRHREVDPEGLPVTTASRPMPSVGKIVQSILEFGKGIPKGAGGIIGSAMKGVAASADLSMLADRDSMGIFEMTQKMREGNAPRGPVKDDPLYRAGTAVQRGSDILPAAPGYEDSLGRHLGEGFGSVVGGIGLSGLTGPVGAGAAFAFAGSGEAVDRAIAAGASEDQIIAAAKGGLIPGLTDSVPLETLMGRIPVPGAKLAARLIPEGAIGTAIKAAGRIGWQALIEGVQEGGQAFLQNVIASEVYAPEQDLGEGVVPEGGMGAGIGGLAEAGRLAITAAAGRRGARGAPASPAPSETASTFDTEGLTPIEAPSEAAPAPTAANVVPNEEALYDTTGETQIGWHDRTTGRVRMLEKQPEEVAAAVMAAPTLDDAIAAAEAEASAPARDPIYNESPQGLEADEGAEIAPVSITRPATETLEISPEMAEIPAEAARDASMAPATLPTPADASRGLPDAAAPPVQPGLDEPLAPLTGRVRGLQRRLTTGEEDAAMLLASKGGIRNDEGHDLVKGRGLQQFVSGLGPLVRPNGMTVDAAGEVLWDAGYFGPPDTTPRPSENEVLQFLERTRRGADNRPTKLYRPEVAVAREMERDGERAQEDNDRALADLNDYANSLGETLSEDDAYQILSDMGAHGIDHESALVEHLERRARQEQDDDNGQVEIPAQAAAAPFLEGEAGIDRPSGSRFEEPETAAGDAGSQGAPGQAAPANSGQEAPAGAVARFSTAKGSTYEVHADGTTTRDKAARTDPGHEGQSGPQPRSEATFYVTDEQANALAEIQTEGGPARAVAQRADGSWGVKYLEGEGAGKFERRTVVTPQSAPAPGLTPVEIFRGGRSVHFGNPITSVGEGAAAPSAPSATTTELKPLTAERGAEGFAQTLVPGSDRSALQLAQAREDRGRGKMQTAKPQQGAGGLFEAPQVPTPDLFAESSPEEVIESAEAEKPKFQRRDANMASPSGGSGVTGTFSPEFDAQREEIAADLRQRLDQMGLTDVALKLPDGIKYEGASMDGAYARKIIAVALDASDRMETLNHEAVHAVHALGLFTKSEWSILANRAARDWRKRYDIDNLYGQLTESHAHEEAIAEAFRHWVKDRSSQKGTIAAIFNKMRDTLSAIGNALRGRGFESEGRIFRRLDAGEIGSRPRATSGPEAIGEAKLQRRDTGPFSRLAIEPSEAVSDYLFDSSLSLTEKLKGAVQPQVINESVDRWRRLFQDRFIPLLRTQEAIEKQIGRKLAAETNPYLNEELSSGRKGAKLEDLSEKMVRPLVANMASRGVSLIELETYLYARHAPERNAHIQQINPDFAGDLIDEAGGSGMTDTEAAAVMAAVKASGKEKDLKALASMVDGILNFALKERVAGGLMSQEQADTWRATFKHYVPLRGKAEVENSKDRPRVGRGINVRGPESQRAFGRKSKAKDILAYAISSAEEAIVRAETNRVGQAFFNLAKENPNSGFWRIDKITERPTWDEKAQQVVYRAANRILAQDKDYTVSLKIDGVEHRVTLERENPNAVQLAKAMRNLDGTKWDALVNTLGHVNRWLSKVNTTLNPEFVVANAFRDAQTALINLSAEDLKGLVAGTAKDYRRATWASMKGAFGAEGGAWGKWYREFRENGGRVYFNQMEDVSEIRSKIEKDIARLSNGKSALNLISDTGDLIEKINLGVENGIRLAAFKNARERGMSPADAASLAKNLTVNFNRRGEIGPVLNTAYLFFNAATQGSARMLLAMRSPKVRKRLFGVAVMAALLDVLNSLITDDDEDGESYYSKVSDHDKRRNLIIMNPFNGRDPIVNLPLPYGYNIFFTMGRGVSEVARGKAVVDALADFAIATLDAFNPIGGNESVGNLLAPTVVDPVVDLLIDNRDFADRPIMPDQPQYGPQIPDNQRYWGSVSKGSKAITDFLNETTGGDEVVPGAIDVSPETLDYAFGQVTGAAGAFYGRLVNLAPKLADPTATVTFNDVPLLRKVISSKPLWYDRSMFYERADAIEDVYQKAKDYRELGAVEKAKGFTDEHRASISMRPFAQSARNNLAKMRKQRNALTMLEARGGISRDTYNTRTNAMEDQEQALITQFNKVYLKQGLPAKP